MFEVIKVSAVALLLAAPFPALGQPAEHEVRGIVTEQDGSTLPGVNIAVKGTRVGTSTDANGEYRLSAPSPSDTLVFSYVGFEQKEAPIRGRSEIHVSMDKKSTEMDEVVVVGYGTQQKSTITGAISSVDLEEAAPIATHRADQMLQGRASGLMVKNTDAAPGGETQIRIRGMNSILGSNNALIVVDGLQRGSDMTSINPQDIKSVEVLKGPSATAIYGSKGSNGVILITTKQGQKEGELAVNYSSEISTSGLAKKMELLSAADYAQEVNAQELAKLVCCFLIAAFALKAHAEVHPQSSDSSVAPEIPSASELRALSKPLHPYLLAPKERIESLKVQIASGGLAQRWYEVVKRQADEYLAAEPSIYEIPDGLRLLKTSNQVLDRVRALALVYRVEGEEQYAERAWEELEAAASFPDWNPRHFLDVGTMTHAFALGYDWLYDYWTDRQKEAISQAIVEYGLKPALATYQGRAEWEGWKEWVRAPMNWNFVCNGGIAIGALAVLEERPQIASRALHEALSNLPYAIKVYAPDGGWNEGPGYWGYGTRYLTLALASLQTTFGSDFGLAEMEGVSQTGWFPRYMTGPLGRSFNFGDAHAKAVRGPQLLWLSSYFEEPAFARYHLQEPTPSVMNLIWLDSSFEKLGPPSTDVSLDKCFSGSGVAAFRSAWRDTTSLFLGFKAGSNASGHTNLDIGTFVLDALGTRWATELGPDDYNLPGYFEKEKVGQRWTYYRIRTEGQNTLVLEPGVAETNQNTGAEAHIVRYASQSQAAFAIADLTPAYAANVQSVQRGVMLRRGAHQEVLIQDEIQADDSVDGWWFMHTRADIEVEAGGKRARLRRNGKQLQAILLTPKAGRFTVRAARPLPTSPDPKGQAKNEGVRKLSIRLKDMTDRRIAVALVPLQAGQTAPEKLPTVRPLEAW